MPKRSTSSSRSTSRSSKNGQFTKRGGYSSSGKPVSQLKPPPSGSAQVRRSRQSSEAPPTTRRGGVSPGLSSLTISHQAPQTRLPRYKAGPSWGNCCLQGRVERRDPAVGGSSEPQRAGNKPAGRARS